MKQRKGNRPGGLNRDIVFPLRTQLVGIAPAEAPGGDEQERSNGEPDGAAQGDHPPEKVIVAVPYFTLEKAEKERAHGFFPSAITW